MKVRFNTPFFDSNFFPEKIRAREILDLHPDKIRELVSSGADMEIIQAEELAELAQKEEQEAVRKKESPKNGKS